MFSILKEKLAERAELQKLAESFDAEFYRRQHAELTSLSDRAALKHYLYEGWQRGFDPSLEFSTRRYLQAYGDVAKAGVNPFRHYLEYGRAEGRDPSPALPSDKDLEALQPHFDFDYYRAVHADMKEHPDEYLLKHFYFHGWKEGRDPSPEFSVTFYLEKHTDIRAQGINPFAHYIRIGEAEGRVSRRAMPRRWRDLTSADIDRLLLLFEAEFYRAQLPQLQGDARTLLQHYVETGWEEGYDPSTDFSTTYYLSSYKSSYGVCPLVHFALRPAPEARRCVPDGPRRLVHEPDAVVLPKLSFPLPGAVQEDTGDVTPPSERSGNGLDLHWVIPDFDQGGGGHMTIFRIIRHLENFGHRCTIWIDRPITHHLTDAAYQDIVRYFQCVGADVRFVQNGFYDAVGDAAIATGWATAYVVQAAQGFTGKFYFVQDYEPEFYPTGTERYFAGRSYSFDLDCICASPWLEQRMRDRHGLWSRSFHLAYDHTIYGMYRNKPDFKRRLSHENGRRKIAVYAREHTERRCVHLAVLALARLAADRDDFEVHFFGQENLSFQTANFSAFNHGILSAEKLAQLYNECDLALCFSATNYSLVPQEMMACGLPLVELDTESTRAIFPEGVVTLAGPDPLDIRDKIGSLLDDTERCDRQSTEARRWVDQFSWEGSARDIEAALVERLGERGVELFAPALAQTHEPLMDVVIPTYNGLGEVEPVIEALRGQRLRDAMQIHCIDSSSTDGTTEWLRSQSDIALTVIDQAEFQHGRTRNQAAALGQAPLIAFLTQDALPAGQDWASDIARMMRHYPHAAGLFGRHLPYPDHSPFVRREIERHFDNLQSKPLAVSKDTNPTRWDSGERGWRQFLHFYSDNNSAMRRSVWEQMPYPEVDYGEDQVWARDIIEAGYTKLYAPTAAVYHSHDYSPEETYKRSYVEGGFFYTQFGYELGPDTEEEMEKLIAAQCEAASEWGHRNQVSEGEIARYRKVLASKNRGLRDGRLAAMATLVHEPNSNSET